MSRLPFMILIFLLLRFDDVYHFIRLGGKHIQGGEKWQSFMLGSISRRGAFAGFIVLAVILGWTKPTLAAIESRSILKTYFETGDVPTQDQFGSLIDSMVNYSDDRSVLGLRVYDPNLVYLPGDTAIMKRFGIGDTTPSFPLGYVNPHANPPLLGPDFGGHLGFLALTLQDSSGIYYGYLQILMQDAVTIEAQFLVFETTPNTPLTMALAPEPGGMISIGIFALALRRRQRGKSST